MMAEIPEALDQALRKFLAASDRQVWNRYDYPWEEVGQSRPHPLSGSQIAAVKTALMVEDHLPGYASEYMRLFPINESLSPEQAWNNRQMMHFITRWVSEEDRHAHILELYLRETKAVEGDELTQEMICEGMKHYDAPHDDHCKLFIYTSLQEKATQLFYQCLRDAVDEPILRAILTRMAGEEARHCTFFSENVKVELVRRGDALVKEIREALDAFKMPLSDMLDNYKRQAINMMRVAQGYDYREAFTHFARMLKRQTDASVHSRTILLDQFLDEIIATGPAPRIAIARA